MSESVVRVTAYDEDDDPVTLDSVRDDHLRVSNGTVEDDYLMSLIRASLGMAQRKTQTRILPETHRLDLSGFPYCIKPPYPPLISVVSIEYYDADNVLQTLDTDVYTVEAPFGSQPPERGSIKLADGQSWPDTFARPDAVKITFRCGYATGSPEFVEVPHEITHARLLIIADLYEHRGSATVGVGTSVTPNVIRAEEMLFGYRDLTAAG